MYPGGYVQLKKQNLIFKYYNSYHTRLRRTYVVYTSVVNVTYTASPTLYTRSAV